MFSVRQKREIASKVQAILRETHHPELPAGEIEFDLHVKGMADWMFADIKNNARCPNPDVNAWNESQDPITPRELLESAHPKQFLDQIQTDHRTPER